MQKIIINNEKFHTIETLKNLMKKVNLKFNNIVYNKQNKQNNKRKTRANKEFSRDNINQKIFNFLIINNRRTFFKNQIQIFQNIKQKNEKRINCYICEKTSIFLKIIFMNVTIQHNYKKKFKN